MWAETIWIILGGFALYVIGTLLVSYLQSRRKSEKKVTPSVKDFWDEKIEEQSKVNPASREYQNSSTKKAADKRKQEYHQKNPPVGKGPVQHIKITTKNTRRSENSRPIDNNNVVGIITIDDSPSDNHNSSSSSNHSSFGHGGSFGGGGAAAYWGGSDHGHSSDSGSSDSGGDGGGSD